MEKLSMGNKINKHVTLKPTRKKDGSCLGAGHGTVRKTNVTLQSTSDAFFMHAGRDAASDRLHRYISTIVTKQSRINN